MSDINPETGLKISEINELGERKRSNVPILIAEDSALLNKLIVDSLKRAGYLSDLSHIDAICVAAQREFQNLQFISSAFQ